MFLVLAINDLASSSGALVRRHVVHVKPLLHVGSRDLDTLPQHLVGCGTLTLIYVSQ